MARYFGTNGVRGTLEVLGPELALRLAQAIGMHFNQGHVLLARDQRLTGSTLHHAVLAGLQSVGCQITDLGIVSSPTAEFMIHRLKADGLIIITASHNPPEWNALKVVDGQGVTVSRERGEAIEKRMDRGIPSAPWDQQGSASIYPHATADHIEAILKFVDAARIQKARLKVVLDCGNGTAALIAPDLFRALGCEIIPINSHLDGRFPGRPSEPTEANVQDLIATVKATSAHLGVAWDGDGDRVILVDEKGRYVIGDQVFALCLDACLQKCRAKQEPPGLIVTTVATSRAIEDIAKAHGSRVQYTAIGAPYLSEAMKANSGLLAGEEVGGVIWPGLSLAKDGFATAARAAELICDKPLSARVDALPVYFNEKVKLPANAAAKKFLVDKVRAHARSLKLKLLELDGVRVDFPDAWVIVRPSGTEPYVRIFAEAKRPEQAKMLVEEFQQLAQGRNERRRR